MGVDDVSQRIVLWNHRWKGFTLMSSPHLFRASGSTNWKTLTTRSGFVDSNLRHFPEFRVAARGPVARAVSMFISRKQTSGSYQNMASRHENGKTVSVDWIQ